MIGSRPWRIARFAAVTLMVCGCLAGAPPLTTIQDVLYKADGSLFNGTALIEWMSFTAADSSPIMTQNLTVHIIKGALKVQLVPTTNAASPAYYRVRYNSDGRVQFEEVWHVPPSTAVLRLRAVRASDTSSDAGAPGELGTEVQISDVVGLMPELASRPVKSPQFSSSRAVFINSRGELESVPGDISGCVHVDGSSGPCGASPAFVDGEVPSGDVNGANAVFGLVSVPEPASSLLLFRNGVLQKQGLDYTLSGSSITFTAAAIPQTGDALVASYRTGGASSLAALTSAPVGAQVLCGGQGAATSATLATVLAACTIPAGTMQAGDRSEIRADYLHTGSTTGFSFEVKWGTATLVARAAPAGEQAVAVKGEAAMQVGGAMWSMQSWGSALGFSAGAGNLSAPLDTDLTISFQGRMASQGAETVALQGYTVIRHPGRLSPEQ